MARQASARTNVQEGLFRDLRSFAQQCGIVVRCEKLSRDLGYRVRSGGCTVNGTKWVIVERTLPARDRVDLLADEIRESVGGAAEMPAHLQTLLRPRPRASGEVAGP